MKKIVVVANNSGGLYGFRKELLRSLVGSGNEVICLTPFDADVDNLKSIGVRVINTPIDRRGINPIKDISLLLKYFKILSVEKPDLVVTYTIKPNIYASVIASLFRIEYANNITGLGTAFQNDDILKKIVSVMYKVAFKKSKVVFFENIDNLNTIVNLGIISRNKTCLLNGAGVNLDEFAFVDYPKQDKTTKFLFMGRVMSEKGINELFNATSKLVSEGYTIELDVLGNYEEHYEEQIHQYENSGWLKYYGYQNDVRPFIEDCNCFVLPSWHEGMANTNLECSSMGRPIITSNIHGCMEAVVENVSGFLCEPKNAQSLYEQMKKFIELPYETKEEMGRQARKHMEEVFDKNKVVSETVKELGL